jgi:hypothetical protein
LAAITVTRHTRMESGKRVGNVRSHAKRASALAVRIEDLLSE